MEEKRESWCGLVVRQDGVTVCMLCGAGDQQVRLFQNTPEEYQALVKWLEGEGCSHVALRPDHDAWKEVHTILKRHFYVRIVHEQQVKPSTRDDRKACCQWLVHLLRSGRLDKQDQVEPIGDRFPHSDEDSLGGQPGKRPEHSGQGTD
jgi:transposase